MSDDSSLSKLFPIKHVIWIAWSFGVDSFFTDARVHKRPIVHPPVASPYAGASIPKVVYVSTKTPFMCAAKRVQKLLGHAEKRAASKVDLSNNRISEKAKLEKVVQAQQALRKEEVIIMATGRAIAKAMNLEKWFKDREEEYEVKVRTKAVLVVDDIFPDSNTSCLEGEETAANGNDGGEQSEAFEEGGEQTQGDPNVETSPPQGDKDAEEANPTPAKSKSLRRKQRAKKRRYVNSDGQPDSRTRYVNGVEIAVSLK